MKCQHAKREVPTEGHEKMKYDYAMKLVTLAQDAQADSEMIHAIFKQVMDFPCEALSEKTLEEAHSRFNSAWSHAQKALAEGKSRTEVEAMVGRIVRGESAGTCKHKK